MKATEIILIFLKRKKKDEKYAVLYIFIPITITEILAVNKTGHFFCDTLYLGNPSTSVSDFTKVNFFVSKISYRVNEGFKKKCSVWKVKRNGTIFLVYVSIRCVRFLANLRVGFIL